MNVFWKAFLGGVVCAALLFVLIPVLVDSNMSLSVVIAKMTSSPLKIVTFLETIGIAGLASGTVFGLMAWVGRRNREREDTDELLREYLKKKLQEEDDKRE
jgi:hypothetical protein